MNVNYDYYRIFYYVAKCGSFTGAAKLIKSSQPNITRAMNNLEAQIGVTLLIRSKKGIRLTPAGMKLYERVGAAMQQVFLAEKELENSQDPDYGVITIGISDIALYEVLYPIIREFHKKYPKIELHLMNESSQVAMTNLKEGLMDFALVSGPIHEYDEFHICPLKYITEIPVCAEEFDGPIEEIHSLKELAQFPLVMLDKGTASRDFYEAFFAEYGAKLNPNVVVSNMNQLLMMVRAGLGIGFVSDLIPKLDSSYRRIPITEPVPPRDLYLVYDTKRALNGAANALIRCILEACDKL